MKRLKRFWIALGLLSVAGIGAQAYRVTRPDSAPSVRTTQVSRGDRLERRADEKPADGLGAGRTGGTMMDWGLGTGD
jgi:hypothetical protein